MLYDQQTMRSIFMVCKQINVITESTSALRDSLSAKRWNELEFIHEAFIC